MPGDARGSVCVAAICRCTSLVCSVVQEYGAAARRRRSKLRRDSAPMNQNSTAAHRPAVPLTTAPDTAPSPPDYPDRDSAVTPPVILTMKVRHLNPRQMISIPEQCVTVRHTVLKAPPGEMRHTAELMNRPPADQPPRQITLHLQPPVGLTQPGQTTGVAVDQRHNLTLHFCLQPVFRRHTEIRLRLTGDIHAGEISFPLRRAYHEAARLRWRTSPGVRQNR